jgi:hypothetical protein
MTFLAFVRMDIDNKQRSVCLECISQTKFGTKNHFKISNYLVYNNNKFEIISREIRFNLFENFEFQLGRRATSLGPRLDRKFV